MEIRNGAPRIGQRVEVYMNLHHAQGFMSIVDIQAGSPTRGKVLAYAGNVTLTNANARIMDGKYDEIHTKHKRAVCAVWQGTLAAIDAAKPSSFNASVNYNPFRRKDFHTATGETVTKAARIHFCNGRGWTEGSDTARAAAPKAAAAAEQITLF